MATYDPKLNRPNLTTVPPSDAPVDAILGPPPPATDRQHLKVIPSHSVEASDRPAHCDEPGLADRATGISGRTIAMSVGLVVVIAVVAVIVRRH